MASILSRPQCVKLMTIDGLAPCPSGHQKTLYSFFDIDSSFSSTEKDFSYLGFRNVYKLQKVHKYINFPLRKDYTSYVPNKAKKHFHWNIKIVA